MAQSRNKAVIAGLTAALTLGSVTLPAMATTSNSTPMTDSDPDGMGVPLPGDYDKADYYEGSEGVTTFASVRSGSTLTPVALSDEMKYFTKYESGCNYDKGLSYGDGYNAMGYYQFDRRYSSCRSSNRYTATTPPSTPCSRRSLLSAIHSRIRRTACTTTRLGSSPLRRRF